MSHELNPTSQAYGELQSAYDFYNAQLFDGRLPPCLITLSRKHGKALGYFIHKRFVQLADGTKTTDEICLNPQYLKGRTLEQSLSTLVHEMCHLEQAHFGQTSRGGYHNKQWGEMMKAVGLIPSNTGEPGGKETGQKMTHYVESNGQFAQKTQALVDGGFSLSWGDGSLEVKAPTKAGSRVKYTCPSCDSNVWGKGGLTINCELCDTLFIGSDNAGDDK
jgi:hypothetical protein